MMCSRCGRDIQTVFDLPRLTVLAVLRNRRHSSASDARTLTKAEALPPVGAYLQHLDTLVGRTVTPAALHPRWPMTWWGLAIPGTLDRGRNTAWTLDFATSWNNPFLRGILEIRLNVSDGLAVVFFEDAGVLACIEVQGDLDVDI